MNSKHEAPRIPALHYKGSASRNYAMPGAGVVISRR